MKLERAVIEVFGGCNYACQMCPQSAGRGKDFTKKMPLDLFIQILDDIITNHGTPIINLEGSGEATVLKDLPLYIEECTKRNLKSFIYCNGANLTGDYMKNVIDAGINFVRFSCIGYNRKLYKKWMSKDNFELIVQNAREMHAYVNESSRDCTISSYHLILDHNNINYEVQQYIDNFINPTGSIGYIWKMHNWSGNYQPVYFRDKTKRKTCGRPFAPEITIRAGGLNGQHGAVTPCCQTMGSPNESLSVLGHVENTSIASVWNNTLYNNLRNAHIEQRFDDVEYCKNCDFLYQDQEILVWSNDADAKTDHLLGTSFSLNDYKNSEKIKLLPY